MVQIFYYYCYKLFLQKYFIFIFYCDIVSGKFILFNVFMIIFGYNFIEYLGVFFGSYLEINIYIQIQVFNSILLYYGDI